MHLLMETAIEDSQQYEVLSFEEIDEMKKEVALLSSRIDATKRKLAIENKLRDAASSLNRLYPSNSRESMLDGSSKPAPKQHRRSVMSRSSGSDSMSKTDEELTATSKKCEDLARDLWRLEKRSQELQKKVLEHTAGVLQITHKGFLEKDVPPQQLDNINGYVGHPETHILGAGHDFDDRSFYQTLDALLEPSDVSVNSQVASAFAQQTEIILETERRLWDLNRRLKDSIMQASAGRHTLPAPPAPESSNQEDSEAMLQGQMDYLEKGLDAIQRSQVDALQGYKQSAYAAEERLEDLNTQLRGIIVRSSQDPNPQYPLPPDVSGRSPEEQIAFLEEGLDELEQSVHRLKDDNQNSTLRSLAHEEKAGQYESVLRGLWQGMETGKEASNHHEDFSLDSFSAKVQSLHNQATGLQEQKDILGRQIQQQRELNSKSDIEKDARLESTTAELEQVRQNLEIANKEFIDRSDALRSELAASNGAKEQLLAELQDKNNALPNLELQLKVLKQNEDSQAANARSLEQSIEEKSAEADKARKEMNDFEGEMVRLQTELTVARAELDGAYGTRAQRAAEVASHPALQKELADLGERNTALLEELAAVKAQREAAGSGSAELNQRVQTLQKELSETINEYEVMTKSSIEYEKEREHLENTIDGLRDQCESLQTQLSDEKVRWLGVKSPGPPGSRDSMEKGATSTAVLKTEFKKMMRETRAENMKALRVGSSYFVYYKGILIVFVVRARRTSQNGSAASRIE